MMMFGLKFMNEVPFRAVYITGIIRDASARRCRSPRATLSIRWSSATNTARMRFVSRWRGWARPEPISSLKDDLLESYRNFATKIWNAARFILRHVEDGDRLPTCAELKQIGSLARRSLDSRAAVPGGAGGQHLARAVQPARGIANIYSFFWHEFCDWYLEMIKLHPERSKPVLLYVFESALRMLHPFMPFITEELWQNMPARGRIDRDLASIRSSIRRSADPEAESQTEMIQDVIVKVRNIRSEMSVARNRPFVVRLATEDTNIAKLLSGAREYIFRLASVSELEIVPRLEGNKQAAQAVAAGCAIEVLLEGLIDTKCRNGYAWSGSSRKLRRRSTALIVSFPLRALWSERLPASLRRTAVGSRTTRIRRQSSNPR